MADPSCRVGFDEGADIHVVQPSFAEGVVKHYWPETAPFEPFGDPFAKWKRKRNGQVRGLEAAQRHERFIARQRQRLHATSVTADETGLPAAAQPAPRPMDAKDEL